MTTGKIAIPYYGSLTHPTSGFERIFFIVEQAGQKIRTDSRSASASGTLKNPNYSQTGCMSSEYTK